MADIIISPAIFFKKFPQNLKNLCSKSIWRQSQEKYDEARQKKLESFGITFLRFTETQIRSNLWAALIVIEEWIKNKKKEEE
ncbi:MAG TPA: DUF559 domain-containing protein [Candidatus Nanoarchaeia archaeon]|nr:DUF559 domain-containing protein [Candidatus Nanoarchaeia archaeon]